MQTWKIKFYCLLLFDKLARVFSLTRDLVKINISLCHFWLAAFGKLYNRWVLQVRRLLTYLSYNSNKPSEEQLNEANKIFAVFFPSFVWTSLSLQTIVKISNLFGLSSFVLFFLSPFLANIRYFRCLI